MIRKMEFCTVLSQHHRPATILDRGRQLDACTRKEDRMRIVGISLLITLTAFELPPAFAAEPVAATPAVKPGPAWGAADVQPTPEHPVYFRWTLGHFPGAQPPLEFWDGTPTTREEEYRDPHDRTRILKKLIPDFAEGNSGSGAMKRHGHHASSAGATARRKAAGPRL